MKLMSPADILWKYMTMPIDAPAARPVLNCMHVFGEQEFTAGRKAADAEISLLKELVEVQQELIEYVGFDPENLPIDLLMRRKNLKDKINQLQSKTEK